MPETQYALVVEDHDDTRNWWLATLPTIFPDSTVLAASTLARARALLECHRFWLALVDLSLPDGSGVELIRELVRRCPGIQCVVNTIHDDDGHLFAALHAGAEGYLLKDVPRARQLEQLGAILQGQPPLSPGIARRILASFHTPDAPADAEPDPRSETERLTPREADTLRLIARGYSRPEVAELLGLSQNTVATYTKTIYRKLRISSRAEAVLEAIRLGLILPRD